MGDESMSDGGSRLLHLAESGRLAREPDILASLDCGWRVSAISTADGCGPYLKSSGLYSA